MSRSEGITRRDFLKLGSGVLILITLRPEQLLAQARRSYPEDINAYLLIGEDGRVTVFSGKIEMGQGIVTSLAQMAAEDLGVSLDAIDMVMGDTDRVPWDMGTFGSLTTRMFGPALRAAAAKARVVLLELASEKLGAPRAELVVEDGVVFVAADRSRSVRYGELAKGKKITRTVGEEAILRSIEQYKVMGRSAGRLDGVEKVTGTAKFAGDIRRPGMLYARLVRPPAHGATMKSADTSKAEKIAGVTLVNRDGMIAVLHADPEIAAKALAEIAVEWNVPEATFDTETIDEHLLGSPPAPEVAQEQGNVTSARAGATELFESTYRTGYVAHAPIEPHVATAELVDGRVTVWASTQTPFPTRARIAQELGLSEERVRVITPWVGGGFGGKSAGLQATEVARLAMITGKPVQVEWTRAEEFFYDTFDPAAVVKVASAIDDEGKISLWDFDIYAAGGRSAEVFYDVPHRRVRTFGGWRGAGTRMHAFNVGPWRAPGANTNVFAMESQIDIMAAAAGIDPLELRLKNTSDARMRSVLEAAAAAFGWRPGAGPTGMGRAIACGIDAGTYVALTAQVKVDRETGAIAVERIVCAQDMGIVVNPDGATMQAEGCIVMGLGYVLTEELRFRGGEILDEGFGTYEIPTFSRVPRIEVVLVKNDDLTPQGGGEPAIVPMGAVIANAVFDATGVRMFRLPMTPERVRAALSAAESS
jgi:nicotinate dehydrogenase subunit B